MDEVDDVVPEVGDEVEETGPGAVGIRAKVKKVYKNGSVDVATDFGDNLRWKRGEFYVVSRSA